MPVRIKLLSSCISYILCFFLLGLFMSVFILCLSTYLHRPLQTPQMFARLQTSHRLCNMTCKQEFGPESQALGHILSQRSQVRAAHLKKPKCDRERESCKSMIALSPHYVPAVPIVVFLRVSLNARENLSKFLFVKLQVDLVKPQPRS